MLGCLDKAPAGFRTRTDPMFSCRLRLYEMTNIQTEVHLLAESSQGLLKQESHFSQNTGLLQWTNEVQLHDWSPRGF